MKPFLVLTALTGAVLLAQASAEIIPSADTITALQTWSIGAGLGSIFVAVQAHAHKIGGLTFVRLGRLSLSFCITKG